MKCRVCKIDIHIVNLGYHECKELHYCLFAEKLREVEWKLKLISNLCFHQVSYKFLHLHLAWSQDKRRPIPPHINIYFLCSVHYHDVDNCCCVGLFKVDLLMRYIPASYEAIEVI